MKRKILSGIVILAIAIVAALNVSLSTKSNDLSNISLANVEALADGEKISYAYDAAGNRISRTIVSLPAVLKSAGMEENEEGQDEAVKEETVSSETIGDEVDITQPEMEVRLYPNPTQGPFTVELNNVPENASGHIYLLNSQGRALDRKDIRSERKIDFDLSGEIPGIYVVTIQLGDAVSTCKIIKK